MRPKKLFLAVALVALGLALWYLGRPSASVEQIPQTQAQVQAPAASELPPSTPEAPSVVETPKPMVAPLPDSLPLWERKIDEALRSNQEPAAIAQLLLQQVPTMPGEGQAASARHIANLIADQDYLKVLPYVQNTRLDKGFQEVIVAESLNRPDPVKLPVLLSAARTPDHPMAEIAKSTLAFLLDADHGTDWAKWEASVRQALEKQTAAAAQ
jgi:hypothetical protein